MKVAYLTVGPVAENTFLVINEEAGNAALLIDPGDEPECDQAGDRATAVPTSRRSCSRTRTSTTSARSSRWPTHRRRGLGAEAREAHPRRHQQLHPLSRRRPVRELRRRARRRPVARSSSSPDSRSTSTSRRVTAPATSATRSPTHSALFSGDVLFQGSIGRTDLPGGDMQTLLDSIKLLIEKLSPDTAVFPGHMGVTTLETEAKTNPFLAPRRQAIRRWPKRSRHRSGTFDVLPADAALRDALVERIAAPRVRHGRIRPHRHADLRGHGAVLARRGGVDRRRQQGDVHVHRPRRSLDDAASRGHRAGLPRVRRARHAQAAAAGQALVPRPVLPPGGAAGRSLPAVLPDRRRGASAATTRCSTPSRSCCSRVCSRRLAPRARGCGSQASAHRRPGPSTSNT